TGSACPHEAEQAAANNRHAINRERARSGDDMVTSRGGKVRSFAGSRSAEVRPGGVASPRRAEDRTPSATAEAVEDGFGLGHDRFDQLGHRRQLTDDPGDLA